MHKLVILIEPVEDWQGFEAAWPEFLHLVEGMPGLRREASSRVVSFLYGNNPCAQMHELFFDSMEEAQRALSSPQGKAAGQLLQHMTRGQMSLFFAEHKEDDLENIRKYQEADDRAE